MGELDVELGHATCVVSAEAYVQRAPSDVEVGVVVHPLGLESHLVDPAYQGEELRERIGAGDRRGVAGPARETVQLSGELLGVQASGHGSTMAQ